MRRIYLRIFLAVVVLTGTYVGWKVFGPSTTFSSGKKYLYIRSGQNSIDEVAKILGDSNYYTSPGWLVRLHNLFHFPQKVYPGKYEIKKHTGIWALLIKMRNNNQAPVKLTITKLRTKEQLASLLSSRFESDSLEFIRYLNDESKAAAYGLDTSTFMTAVMPNTYELLWTSDPETIFSKLWKENRNFWTEERKRKAQAHGLNPEKAYILASIIEEETNMDADKDTIASVYINRLNKGMRLQADPTVKFALRDFGLKRIYEKHLAVESPYNTYRNEGLPPGPICTPSYTTLDAVLDAPKTGYVYFVAKSDFSGKHMFSDTYEKHLDNARAFQRAQNEQLRIRQSREANTKRP